MSGAEVRSYVQVTWYTVDENGNDYARGATREEAIASHKQAMSDIAETIAELEALGKNSRVQQVGPPIGVRRVRTTTTTVTEEFETERLDAG